MLNAERRRKINIATEKGRIPDGPLSTPAKIGFSVQDNSGVLEGKINGGISLNQTCRVDGTLWKQQMAACLERSQTAKSPDQRMIYVAAYNRMQLCEQRKEVDGKAKK